MKSNRQPLWKELGDAVEKIRQDLFDRSDEQLDGQLLRRLSSQLRLRFNSQHSLAGQLRDKIPGGLEDEQSK